MIMKRCYCFLFLAIVTAAKARKPISRKSTPMIMRVGWARSKPRRIEKLPKAMHAKRINQSNGFFITYHLPGVV